jgi:hypothetical protein
MYRRQNRLSSRSGIWIACMALLSAWFMGCGGAAYKAEAPSQSQGYYGGAAPAAEPASGSTETMAKESADEGSSDSANAGPPPPSPVAAGAPGRAAPMDKAYGQEGQRDMRMAQAPKKAPQTKPTEPAPQPSTNTTPDKPKEVASDAAPIMQMLIYTARLTMAVFEVDKSLAGVETLAREMGGFLARRSDREIVIRVPTAKFFDVLKKLDGMGDMLHKDVQVEDVTEQYLDISLRLKNAREVRDRIAALLASAKTVEDSLKVERELERLSAEIEHMEGRLKYLRDRAAYSTITISFQPMQVEDLQRQKVFRLPFNWLSEMGLGRLLNLH